MLDSIRQLIKPKYRPLNRIEIFKKNILDNYKYLKSQSGKAEIWPVLKANAYGHGLKEMCRILNKSKAKMVVVDSFPEAQIAYKKFHGQVLILSEMPLRAYSYCNLKRTEFCVYNNSTLQYLSKLNKNIKIHLFVNTGMNREGIGDLDIFLNENKDYLSQVEIVGFCSHFSAADESLETIKKQEQEFWRKLDTLKKNNIFPTKVHLGNSAAIFFCHDQRLTAFRAGLALYGYNPLNLNHPNYQKAENLKPALRLSSTVACLQNIKKGDSVSYNGRYQANEDARVAIIPFGYFEGLSANWENIRFYIENKNKNYYADTIGRICMNICCLDCHHNPISVGDSVELISPDKNKENSLANLAIKTRTMSYEILAKLQSGINKKIV
jgi:alanine racemase